MKNLTGLVILLFALLPGAKAQDKLHWSAVVQQAGMFYSAEQITSAGVGMGVGLQVFYKEKWIGQADANLYWLNGNAFSYRLAAGIQKPGKWSPAVLAGFTVISGDRTEIILADGKRPSFPVVVPAIRIAPLRFQHKRSAVSIFEIGAGLGPQKGVMVHLSIISLGINLR